VLLVVLEHAVNKKNHKMAARVAALPRIIIEFPILMGIIGGVKIACADKLSEFIGGLLLFECRL
jgi:hypothetical protein